MDCRTKWFYIFIDLHVFLNLNKEPERVDLGPLDYETLRPDGELQIILITPVSFKL